VDDQNSSLSAFAHNYARHSPGARRGSSVIRFLAVGAVGFLVDASLTYLFVFVVRFDYLLARFLSFVLAVGVTLSLNRTWTFREVRDRPVSRSFIYVVAQVLGGIVNIGLYAAAAWVVPSLRHWLIIPLSLGSAGGLLVTYSMSRFIAFRPTPASDRAQ
jgi:putative flippase GtrA